MEKLTAGPIGIFDSGYGGLTILSEIQAFLPEYDYIYLGDNSRAPYGSRSFDIVYEFSKQAVEKLFSMGCNLVIMACNTASAKALRTIQQNDLPKIHPYKRVLGVIRPTVEILGELQTNGHIGILGTAGTIQSESYDIEINKFYPHFKVTGEACPMWVPLIENKEFQNEGANYYIRKNIENLLNKDPYIDTVVLGCTHYPLLINKIKSVLPSNINIVSQGKYVAQSLKTYLYNHPDLEKVCTKNGYTRYLTTEAAEKFEESASIFLNKNIKAERISIG